VSSKFLNRTINLNAKSEEKTNKNNDNTILILVISKIVPRTKLKIIYSVFLYRSTFRGVRVNYVMGRNTIECNYNIRYDLRTVKTK